MASALLLAFALSQDSSPAEIATFIESLGSDQIEERDDAEAKLLSLGASALPALKREHQNSDLEIAERSRHLTARISFRQIFRDDPPEVLRDLEKRALQGDNSAWTVAFLNGAAGGPDNPRKSWITRADLERMLLPALRGASPNERTQVLGLAHGWKCRARLVDVLLAVPEPVLLDWFDLLDPEGALPELMTRIRSGEDRYRWQAVSIVELHAIPRATPALVSLLDDPDVTVRRIALGLIFRVGAQGEWPTILPFLHDRNSDLRQCAAAAVGRLKMRSAVPDLVRLLDDPAASVIAQATETLGKLGAREAIPKLLTLLEDPRPRVQGDALRALAEMDERKAIPAAIARLEVAEVRDAVGVVLCKFKPPEAVPALQAALGNEDVNVVQNALVVLRDSNEGWLPKHVQLLLRNRNPQVRGLGLWVARSSEQPCLGRELVPLLNDGDAFAYDRGETAGLLGEIRCREAIPQLREALHDPEPSVRAKVVAALTLLEAREAASEVQMLLAEGGETQAVALEFLRSLHIREAAADVAALLESFYDDERVDAIETLGLLEDSSVIPSLERQLRDPWPPVRGAASIALARLGSVQSIPAIKFLLRSNYVEDQTGASKALGLFGGSGHLPALRALLGDASDAVRLEAARALVSILGRWAVFDLCYLQWDERLGPWAGSELRNLRFGFLVPWWK